jgi:hypothetical protein
MHSAFVCCLLFASFLFPADLAAAAAALLLLLLPRPRAVKLVAVVASLLTPQVIHDGVALLQACFTDERISR